MKQLGPLTYLVRVYSGALWKQHIDQTIAIDSCTNNNENEITPPFPYSKHSHNMEQQSSTEVNIDFKSGLQRPANSAVC